MSCAQPTVYLDFSARKATKSNRQRGSTDKSCCNGWVKHKIYPESWERKFSGSRQTDWSLDTGIVIFTLWYRCVYDCVNASNGANSAFSEGLFQFSKRHLQKFTQVPCQRFQDLRFRMPRIQGSRRKPIHIEALRQENDFATQVILDLKVPFTRSDIREIKQRAHAVQQ